MSPFVFISYRRGDTQQAAQGLYLQLRARIGTASVFMDRAGIVAGNVWPDRLTDALKNSTLVLALIGPGWLRAADEYGRRRLDLEDDWVRRELAMALSTNRTVIPVIVGSSNSMPSAEALPAALMPLAERQAYTLRDEHWDSDFKELVGLLVERHGFKEVDQKVRLPEPKVQNIAKALTQAELELALKSLPGWEPVESLIPGDYPRSRHELRKVYVFKSFRAAVQFMSSAIDPISAVKHHPRWENQWRTVTVYLSTWDIGFKISQFDIDLAKLLDRVFERSPAMSGAASPNPGQLADAQGN